MSNVSLTAMERVLFEIKSLNDQIGEHKQQRTLLEDDINDKQFERTRMEQKVSSMKHRSITDEVKLEQNLKSELESKKMQLDQLQEQVLSVKRLIIQETTMKGEPNGERQEKDHYRVDRGLGEIKSIISDLTIGLPIGKSSESNDQQINDLNFFRHQMAQ